MSRKTKRFINMFGSILIDLTIFIGLNMLIFLSAFSLTDYQVWIFIGSLSILKILSFFCFNEYRLMSSVFGLSDALKLFILSVVTGIISYGVMYCIPFFRSLPVQNCILYIFSEALLVLCVRFMKRVLSLYLKQKKRKTKRTIVIGAGAGAKLVYDECRTNNALDNLVVAFVDDDKSKIGKLFSGRPIEGPIENVEKIIEKYQAEEIIIAIANLDKKRLYQILDFIQHINIKVKRLPLMSEMGKKAGGEIVNVNIDELLARNPVELDTKDLFGFIHEKVVLVTGAGGSIGSELVRQIFRQRPSVLVLLDIYENALYDIQQELVQIQRTNQEMESVKLVTLVGATYNDKRMENIFKRYHPQLVFHAAAYKHVPLMEDSPTEAIRSNVIGTYNIANLSSKYGVEKMVLVSTDKAVRPTNVMGATKRFAEMIIQYFDQISPKTKYSATRFGNVLGSNGSVVPLFKKQIESGGPVTVTDLEMRRFFMTIPEAVGLILQSAIYAKGGEIFILDMGKPVKIIDLAERMIRQAGYEPYTEIPIKITGLRPGEKIYEELLLDLSTQIRTENKKIFIERPEKIKPMLEEIEFISQVFELENAQDVKDLLAKVIVTYHQPERDKIHA